MFILAVLAVLAVFGAIYAVNLYKVRASLYNDSLCLCDLKVYEREFAETQKDSEMFKEVTPMNVLIMTASLLMREIVEFLAIVSVVSMLFALVMAIIFMIF